MDDSNDAKGESKMVFMKVFSVVSAIAAWSQRALADGKIDAGEAAELIGIIASTLGVTPEIKL